jgi:hypothetical protein
MPLQLRRWIRPVSVVVFARTGIVVTMQPPGDKDLGVGQQISRNEPK